MRSSTFFGILIVLQLKWWLRHIGLMVTSIFRFSSASRHFVPQTSYRGFAAWPRYNIGIYFSQTPSSVESKKSLNYTMHDRQRKWNQWNRKWCDTQGSCIVTRSVGVGRTFTSVCLFKSVCLFVCFSVCPDHSLKTKDRIKCSNLVVMILGYPKVVRFWRRKVKLWVRVDNLTALPRGSIRTLWVHSGFVFSCDN